MRRSQRIRPRLRFGPRWCSDEGAPSAAAATLVAAAFTLSTLDRWLAARRRHELAWTIALAMFTIASASPVVGRRHWLDRAAFRVFFLFGAILNVPWLALGTVDLLGGRRLGRPDRRRVWPCCRPSPPA